MIINYVIVVYADTFGCAWLSKMLCNEVSDYGWFYAAAICAVSYLFAFINQLRFQYVRIIMADSIAENTICLLVFYFGVIIVEKLPLEYLFLFIRGVDINVHFLTKIFLCFILFSNYKYWLLFLTIIFQIFLSNLVLVKMWICIIQTFRFRYDVIFRFWLLWMWTTQMGWQIAHILIVTFQIPYCLIKLSLTFVLYEFTIAAVATVSL